VQNVSTSPPQRPGPTRVIVSRQQGIDPHLRFCLSSLVLAVLLIVPDHGSVCSFVNVWTAPYHWTKRSRSVTKALLRWCLLKDLHKVPALGCSCPEGIGGAINRMSKNKDSRESANESNEGALVAEAQQNDDLLVATESPDKESPESRTTSSTPRKRNAFSELMAAKPKQQKSDGQASIHVVAASKPGPESFRSGLLAYITNPSSFPSGTIIRETEHTILIRDLYPKALIHLLMLPKDTGFYSLTPFEAFNPEENKNAAFLELMKSEAASAADLAASELSRLVSPYSATCKTRNEALNSDDPPDELPPARDFLPDIRIGVHAQPSMNTLHIHIISCDMYSAALKHKKHYNSFNTNFFISLEDFPLMEEDNLMDAREQENLIKGDMRCWRCGRNFGNKFKQLKDHLQEEYEAWREI